MIFNIRILIYDVEWFVHEIVYMLMTIKNSIQL